MKSGLVCGVAGFVLAVALFCDQWCGTHGVSVAVPGQRVCHVSAERGALTATLFSTVAEEESYRRIVAPFWVGEMVLLGAAGLAVWQWRRARRKERRGFPVEVGTGMREAEVRSMMEAKGADRG